MTFATIQAGVSRLLNGERFWTPEDIQTAINAAYLEVCEYTECFETQTTLTLVPGVTYYDFETPARDGERMRIDEFSRFPSGANLTRNERMRFLTVGFAPGTQNDYLAVLTPLRVWNNQTKIWLDITTVSRLDRERPRWGTTDGEPQWWFPRGISTFGVYPRPSTSTTSTLLIRHSAVPNVMIDSAAVPQGIPRQFEEVLELGAVSYLKGLEREPKAAVSYYKLYAEKREQLFEHVQRRTSRLHIPTYGGSQVGARR